MPKHAKCHEVSSGIFDGSFSDVENACAFFFECPGWHGLSWLLTFKKNKTHHKQALEGIER